jgi:hypothetical protein
MIYEVDPDFDLEGWRADTGTEKPKRPKATPSYIRELVTEQSMNRKELVLAITERTDCKKSTAYAAVDSAIGSTIVAGPDGKFIAA